MIHFERHGAYTDGTAFSNDPFIFQYINEPVKNKRANCEFKAGIGGIRVKTIRPIEKGEELFIVYQVGESGSKYYD